jgi:hypothetical protein
MSTPIVDPPATARTTSVSTALAVETEVRHYSQARRVLVAIDTRIEKEQDPRVLVEENRRPAQGEIESS